MIGRWGVIDKVAEKYDSWSPYVYVGNNPVKNIDAHGDSLINASSPGSEEYKATASALNILKISNPEAYAVLESANTNYSIVYAELNPGTGTADGTTTISTTTLNGVTNTPSGASQGLSADISKDADGNLSVGGFTRNLNGDEQDQRRAVGQNLAGQKKSISLDDANKLVQLGKDGKITLDKSLVGNQKQLTIALGHEFGHGAFSQLNKALGFIFGKIDGKNGGHGKNNPSGKRAKEEEEKARKNYDKAKKQAEGN